MDWDNAAALYKTYANADDVARDNNANQQQIDKANFLWDQLTRLAEDNDMSVTDLIIYLHDNFLV